MRKTLSRAWQTSKMRITRLAIETKGVRAGVNALRIIWSVKYAGLETGSLRPRPQEKAKLFRDVFFANPPEADLSVMDGATHPEQIKLPQITIDEVEDAILATTSNNAPSPDRITNKALQAVVTRIREHLTRIFNARLDLGYCPQHFRSFTTVGREAAENPPPRETTPVRRRAPPTR
jgi:hypothetical protein